MAKGTIGGSSGSGGGGGSGRDTPTMYVAPGVPRSFGLLPSLARHRQKPDVAGRVPESLIGPFPGAAGVWHDAPDSLDEH
ncbi:MAG TPA: hypothetical protein VFM54_00085 [Micromonosporaceae bacterium]|nr:hypothetical protein [Micromonosporaceae bacterium]